MTEPDAEHVEPSGSTSASYAFIGAVHLLLDSDREATRSDLLLAAACHSLYEGDRTAAELLARANQIWPGARADMEGMQKALDLGQKLQMVASADVLGEIPVWTLTKEGVRDVERHGKWVGDAREAALAKLVERARTGLGIDPSREEAELWLGRLVSALVHGIQASQVAYLGHVEEIVGGRLLPKGFDPELVLSALPDGAENPVNDFLRTLALAALDPLDPFGNDLISHITTGCVLHSYVAGRDASPILDQLGPQQAERAVLDTPVLLALIGPTRLRRHAETTLEAAVAAGWDVVTCVHSLTELEELLDRELPNIQESFARANAAGIREDWYASLDEDQLPSVVVEVLKDGTYQSLNQFRSAATRLPERLEALGVTVREHHNEEDPYLDRCRQSLTEHLQENSRRARSASVIDRDAQSMAVAWRRRRRQTKSKWPGAWIITSDRQLTPAYFRAQHSDKVALTLSMAQWTTLVAATSPPTSVVELATAAAGQLVEEAMWLIPARFPSDVALNLARQLSPEHGGSGTDVRVAQLTLDDVFDQATTTQQVPELAAKVLSSRARRVDAIQAQRQRDLVLQAADAKHLQLTAQREAELARDNERVRAMEADVLKTESADLSRENAWLRTQRRRVVISSVLIALGAVVLVWTWSNGMTTATRWALGSTAIAGLAAIRWCLEPSSKGVLVFAGAAVDAIAFVSAVVGLQDS